VSVCISEYRVLLFPLCVVICIGSVCVYEITMRLLDKGVRRKREYEGRVF
jgi:hypothetical protein